MTTLQSKSGEFIFVNQFYHQLCLEKLKIQKLFGVSIEEEVSIIYYNLKQSDIGENNFCDDINRKFRSEFTMILGRNFEMLNRKFGHEHIDFL
jgi:hypothetical protein